jgi:hypothetical protein
MRGSLLATVTALGLLLAAGAADAQRPLPLEADGPVLRLELAKPIFDIGQFHDAHFATTAMDASILLPVHPAVALFGQLGITFGQIGGLGWSSATSNPRLGAALGRDGALSASLYTDLPLGQEMGNSFAAGVGRFTYFEEWARYGVDTWGVGGSATAQGELAPGAVAGARVDGTLLVPLKDGVDQDVLGLLTLFAEAPAGEARLWIELSGFALLSESDLGFSERTTAFGTVSLSLPTYRFAPEAYLRVPLDENLAGIIRFVVGARMHFGSTRPAA